MEIDVAAKPGVGIVMIQWYDRIHHNNNTSGKEGPGTRTRKAIVGMGAGFNLVTTAIDIEPLWLWPRCSCYFKMTNQRTTSRGKRNFSCQKITFIEISNNQFEEHDHNKLAGNDCVNVSRIKIKSCKGSSLPESIILTVKARLYSEGGQHRAESYILATTCKQYV